MQELIDLALDMARTGGAGYADIRIVEQATESLTVKNGNLAQAGSNRSAGFGVRALVDGAWGFAGSSRIERAEVERTAREAVAIARASGLATREPIVLDDSPPVVATYRTPYREDPFEVPLDEKLRILFE
jgi:TldD protein